MPKIEIKGWIEESDKEPISNIPKKCPVCKSVKEKLRRVDALRTCGMYMVYCPDSTCRWCEIYEE